MSEIKANVPLSLRRRYEVGIDETILSPRRIGELDGQGVDDDSADDEPEGADDDSADDESEGAGRRFGTTESHR